MNLEQSFDAYADMCAALEQANKRLADIYALTLALTPSTSTDRTIVAEIERLAAGGTSEYDPEADTG